MRLWKYNEPSKKMKKQHKPDVGSMLSSVGKVWSERLSLESIEMCYRFAVSKILKIQSFWRLLQVAYSCLDMFRLHAFRLLFGSAVFLKQVTCNKIGSNLAGL